MNHVCDRSHLCNDITSLITVLANPETAIGSAVPVVDASWHINNIGPHVHGAYWGSEKQLCLPTVVINGRDAMAIYPCQSAIGATYRSLASRRSTGVSPSKNFIFLRLAFIGMVNADKQDIRSFESAGLKYFHRQSYSSRWRGWPEYPAFPPERGYTACVTSTASTLCPSQAHRSFQHALAPYPAQGRDTFVFKCTSRIALSGRWMLDRPIHQLWAARPYSPQGEQH